MRALVFCIEHTSTGEGLIEIDVCLSVVKESRSKLPTMIMDYNHESGVGVYYE